MVDLNHLDRHIFSDRARHPAFYLVGHPDRGTQLAGRAIAALEAIMLDEGVLERKQMAGLSEAFNRSDRTILILHGQGEAGVDPFAVDQYRASSAGALVATLLGAGESQMFAEKIEQRSAYIRFEIEGLAIYKEMHGGLHGTVTPARHRAMKRRTLQEAERRIRDRVPFCARQNKHGAAKFCRMLGFGGRWRLKTRCRSERSSASLQGRMVVD